MTKSLDQIQAETTAYVEGHIADYIDNLNRAVVGVGDFSDGVIAAFNQAAMHIRDGSYKDEEGAVRFLKTAEQFPIDVNFAEDMEQARKDEIDDIRNKGVDSFSNDTSIWDKMVVNAHLGRAQNAPVEGLSFTQEEIDNARAELEAFADRAQEEDPGAGLDFDAFGGEDNDELRLQAQETMPLFAYESIDNTWERMRQTLSDSRMEGEALKENALAAAESDPSAVYGDNGQPKKVRQQMTFEEGKYTLLQYEDGTIEAHRYGKPWREFIGDKFMGVVAEELFVINQMFNR